MLGQTKLIHRSMKVKEYNSFQIEGSSLKVAIPVPESIDEYDTLAGKPGLCLVSAVDNVVYRNVLNDFRYYFCEEFEKAALAEFPGYVPDKPEVALKRKTKLVGKGKTGNEEKYAFAEGEAEYVRRVLPVIAQLRGVEEVKVDSFQSIVDAIMADVEEYGEPDPVTGVKPIRPKVSFDPSEAERGERQPKTLPKRFLAAGNAIIAAGKADKWMAKYEVKPVVFPADADQSKKDSLIAEAIGWKIKTMEDAEAAKINVADKYGV